MTDVALCSNFISLFAGAGGLDLALRLAMPDARCVCYVEREVEAVQILAARFADQALDDAPVWSDVSTFDGKPWRGLVDGIAGGFPCQDLSVAGKRGGIKRGNRSGLWFEYARIIREVEPGWVYIENVPGLFTGRGPRFPCVCCWPDRWRGVYRNPRAEDIGEGVLPMHSGDWDDDESHSNSESDTCRTWRESEHISVRDEGLGGCRFVEDPRGGPAESYRKGVSPFTPKEGAGRYREGDAFAGLSNPQSERKEALGCGTREALPD